MRSSIKNRIAATVNNIAVGTINPIRTAAGQPFNIQRRAGIVATAAVEMTIAAKRTFCSQAYGYIAIMVATYSVAECLQLGPAWRAETVTGSRYRSYCASTLWIVSAGSHCRAIFRQSRRRARALAVRPVRRNASARSGYLWATTTAATAATAAITATAVMIVTIHAAARPKRSSTAS